MQAEASTLKHHAELSCAGDHASAAHSQGKTASLVNQDTSQHPIADHAEG